MERDGKATGVTAADRWLSRLADRWGPWSDGSDAEATAEAIATRHGEAGEHFAKLAIEGGADRTAVFRAKNATLALSIDASLAWSLPLYSAQLALVHDLVERLAPETIVDLGCEQGIVTCFVAALAPDSRVVGIDPCAEAVERAAELAAELGIGNVRFERMGIGQAPEALGPMADLTLTSRAVIGEAIPSADDLPPELLPGELPARPGWSAAAARLADGLAGRTRPGGSLLSIERSGTSGIVRWAGSLSSAGFAIQAPVTSIAAPEPGDADARFRVVQARLDPDEPGPPAPSGLLGPPSADLDDGCVDGEEAERRALRQERLAAVEAWEWRNSSGDRERLELGECPDGSLVELRCSTNGERSFALHPAAEADSIRASRSRELAALDERAPLPVEPLLGRQPLPS